MKIKFGFSIIEVLAVIAIIAIISAAITPVLANRMPGIRLGASARLLISKLKEAQQKSVSEQNNYLIRFNSPGAGSYQLIRIVNLAEETISTFNLPSGTVITLAPSITNNQIIYYANGSPSSNGQITLTLGTINQNINILPSGFVQF